MKTIAATLLALTALFTFSSCKTVIVEPSTRTTTTEETTVRRPGATIGTTTQTHETEVRRY
jgi:hypothetical protein